MGIVATTLFISNAVTKNADIARVYLYEEIPLAPWGEKRWTLYHTFKFDIRAVNPVLESCKYTNKLFKTRWIIEVH